MNEYSFKPDKQVLIDLVKTKMPFGKYKDTLICDVPLYYLEWFKSKGFPKGKIGVLLETAFEIKSNGLDDIIKNLKNQF